MARQYFEVNTIDVCNCRRFILLQDFVKVLCLRYVRSRGEHSLVDRVEGQDLESHCFWMK